MYIIPIQCEQTIFLFVPKDNVQMLNGDNFFIVFLDILDKYAFGTIYASILYKMKLYMNNDRKQFINFNFLYTLWHENFFF